VVVPYANNSDLTPECVKSLEKLQNCKEIDVDIMECQGATISKLRSNGVDLDNPQVVKKTITAYDYYMAIDSDIEFEVEDVLKLLSHNLDIVSGAYQFRGDMDLMVAGIEVKNPGTSAGNLAFTHWGETGLREVDWVGAGFLLIKKEVLEAMEYPYFFERAVQYTSNGVLCSMLVGEDVGFCLSAREAGFKIHCDCDVKVKHIVDFKPMRKDGFRSPQDCLNNFMHHIELIKKCGLTLYQGYLPQEEVEVPIEKLESDKS
jgi:hypothetical protein